MARTTRESILVATAELMRVKGFGAVAMKDVVAASGAPIGSIYHHFPGGKTQIAREALLDAGAAYGLLIPTLTAPYDDLGEAVEALFDQAATDMAQTGFANMCPVGSVAAEVADTVDDLREATAAVFSAWTAGGTAYFVARGLPEATAREVTVAVVAALEGAFILARALRDTAPLTAAGRAIARGYVGVPLTPTPTQAQAASTRA